MMKNFKDLINMFNEGDTDFLNYMNGFDTFLKMVERRGLINELDFNMIYETEYENEFLIFLYNHNNDEFWNIVSNYLSDLKIENGVPTIVVNEPGEFANLFCNNRDISTDTIEALLNGEYDSHSYGWSSYDLTDDVYRDVIEELTKENLLYLKEYIIKSLEGKQITPYTELLEDYAQQQGHPEYVIIDQSNIDQVVDNSETMNELMDNELDELKGELYSIYGSAYNSAYEEELYADVWNELETYFEKGQWTSKPHPYKENTSVDTYTAKAKDIDSIILDFLKENKGQYGAYGSLEYYGSLIGIIQEIGDCLSFYPSDYPDSRLVDKNINMYFGDYI
jgi:hypothetical protein